MSEFEIMESGLDPRLLQMLNAYAVVPARDPQSARRNRERFETILDTIFEDQASRQREVDWFSFGAWSARFDRLQEMFAGSARRRAVLAASVLLIVLVLFLFGSMGITAFAARSSLPGDGLYPLKTRIENARAGMTFDPATRARLYTEFAGRRLLEIQSLIREGRHDDLALAAGEFERDVWEAVGTIESLAQTDPARAVTVRAETAVILRGYANVLNRMLVDLPADTKPVIQSAINVSQSAVEVLDFDDDFNDDEDDEAIGTPSTQSGTTSQSTDTPYSLLETSPTLQAAGLTTPLPAATEPPPAAATPIPPATQAGGGPIVQGGDSICQGFLGAVTVENLEVPQGASCTLDGTRVQGNLFVRNGASLTAQRVTVIGNIQAEGARLVEVLAGSTVGGSIQLKQGGSARVENVRVTGDLQFESNNGVFTAAHNEVGGNIQVFQNVGGATISGNFVNGNLQCKENSPPPGGGSNTVQGNKEDQCAGL